MWRYSFPFFFWGGGGKKWSESRVVLISIQKALPTLNPYGSNFKAISKRRTHPSYQMIKSIIFVGCVRIYCCKDFNVCPQAAISKNKSNKILKNISPAVNKIMFVMRAAFLEWIHLQGTQCFSLETWLSAKPFTRNGNFILWGIELIVFWNVI